MSVVFDKLSFVKRLEDGGCSSRPQAETQSDAFHQVVSQTVATKQDLTATRLDLEESVDAVRTDVNLLRSELPILRSGVRNKFGLIRSEFKAAMAETRVWTVSVGATIIAVLAAMKYSG